MMFSLLSWILICAAFCILSSTSSNAGVKNPPVSLTCNENQEVVAGITLTLNCTIQLPLEENCLGDDYSWEDSNNNTICNSTTYGTVNYTCEWDGETYVSLVIRKVTESQNFTVQISTDCGYRNTSTVEVKHHQARVDGLMATTTPPYHSQDSSTVTIIGLVFIIVSVSGILSALFTTKRGKAILKCSKRGRNPEYMDASQDSA